MCIRDRIMDEVPVAADGGRDPFSLIFFPEMFILRDIGRVVVSLSFANTVDVFAVAKGGKLLVICWALRGYVPGPESKVILDYTLPATSEDHRQHRQRE